MPALVKAWIPVELLINEVLSKGGGSLQALASGTASVLAIWINVNPEGPFFHHDDLLPSR